MHCILSLPSMQDLRTQLTEALDRTATTSRDVWKSYWAAQQRFFKLLCVSFKVRRRSYPTENAECRHAQLHAPVYISFRFDCYMTHESDFASRILIELINWSLTA